MTCACIGCHGSVAVVIDHPRHGRRAVCQRHAKGQTTLQEVPA
jgi:hypothetical protein